MIWIAHILSLDFQVRSCPLAVLLWLDWVLYKLLELLRWSSFNAFHEGDAALPIMWGASESYRALRVVLEHEGRADVTFRSLMIHHTLLLADFGLIAGLHWWRNIFHYLIFAFLQLLWRYHFLCSFVSHIGRCTILVLVELSLWLATVIVLVKSAATPILIFHLLEGG